MITALSLHAFTISKPKRANLRIVRIHNNNNNNSNSKQQTVSDVSITKAWDLCDDQI